MSNAPFVHLRVHTAYSLSEGAIRVKDLAKRCAELGMPAVAMADTGNLHGVYSFTNAMFDAGVQPIIGVQAQLAASDGAKSPIVLIAKDKTGYFNLIRVVSEAALRGDGKEEPVLIPRDLKERQEGLILLTGGPAGPIDTAIRQGREDLARKRLEFFRETFGDRAYVEIQRHTPHAKGSPGERRLIALADELGMPLVATNEAFYLTRDMREAQDVLLCIAEGSYLTEQDRRRVDPEAYLKTPEQMCEIFADLPDAIANTTAIAKRCAVAFQKAKPILPRFPCGEGRTEDDELEHQAQDGLEDRFVQLGIESEETRAEYRARLAFEVDIIKKMKFPGYFLIVSDYIKWAKAHDIPVGPGRGSGAGSLVAYALKITDLDPIRYGLLFERFLNPERVSMPDFDVDFCEARREEVIEYCRQRYGAERVCQIATFGKLAARAVLRDVGRVLQLPYPVVDRYCKLIPNNPSDPKTLGQAMELDDVKQAFNAAEPDVQRMFRIGLKLEGLYRHSSKHAAGVVISDLPIHEICPVMRDPKDGVVVAQWDMKGVEPCGLVKFDFLGLRNLDIIKGTIDMAREGGEEIDFDKIGVDDAPTYEMIANADTFAVFQLAGGGMRGACRQVRPNTLDDVIALVSLYRPGPMDNIPKYKAVKFGEEQPVYHHPAQEAILKDTFSIMIYQEQVMQLAQTMAGYTLGDADLLRRAMGKKIKEEMDAQRAIFVEGCAMGWLYCTLDDGRTVRLHPRGKVKLKGSDEKVLVQDAIDKGLEIDV